VPEFYARSWSDLKIFRQRDPFRGMLRSIQPEVGRFKVQPIEASRGVASKWGRIVRSKRNLRERMFAGEKSFLNFGADFSWYPGFSVLFLRGL
jgi:hypothetical protein